MHRLLLYCLLLLTFKNYPFYGTEKIPAATI
jgi:hypothetical protein